MAKVVPISIDINKGKLPNKPKGIEMVECKTIEETRRDQLQRLTAGFRLFSHFGFDEGVAGASLVIITSWTWLSVIPAFVISTNWVSLCICSIDLHPTYPTSGALIYVAILMLGGMEKLNWSDTSELLPALIIIVMIPLTFSIANGIARSRYWV